jgi:hypothetical protein
MRARTTSLRPPPSRTGRFRRSPSPPRAPASSIASWELCSRRLPLIYHQSCIPVHALVACGPTTPCLIPACGRADNAQLGMLCALPFWGSPRSWSSRGGRFFGLPSLFAFVGVRLPWRKCKSFRPPHVREGAQRDPFTSMKQLRPLPPRTSASCARTSCISCAYRWGSDDDAN